MPTSGLCACLFVGSSFFYLVRGYSAAERLLCLEARCRSFRPPADKRPCRPTSLAASASRSFPHSYSGGLAPHIPTMHLRMQR